MRILFAIVAGMCAESILAQSDVWQHASRRLMASEHPYTERQIHWLALSRAQQKSLFRLLNARSDVQSCLTEDPTFFDKLRYGTVPVSRAANVVLVEAGPGCLRGGQGSNGSMWLVRFDGPRLTLLANPQNGFEGWIYSIEPTSSNGYRDIIIGWHVSAFESALSYLRYDGRSYHSIAAATLRTDESGISSIVPEDRTIRP